MGTGRVLRRRRDLELVADALVPELDEELELVLRRDLRCGAGLRAAGRVVDDPTDSSVALICMAFKASVWRWMSCAAAVLASEITFFSGLFIA